MSDYPEQEALSFFREQMKDARLQIISTWRARNNWMFVLSDGERSYLAIKYSDGSYWSSRDNGTILDATDTAEHVARWAGIPEFE